MDIMTPEQAIEAAKGLTFEKVWATMMEDRKRMQETNDQMQKQNEESRKRMQEIHDQMQKTHDQTQKEMRESQRKTDKILADLSKNLGGLGNTLGELTESMFSVGLWEKFAEYGIPVSSQSEHKTFYSGKKALAEADIFIENGEYALPVEVKTKLSVQNVDEHIERIEVIRQYFDDHGDKRKLLGAVAGGVIHDSVMKYALNQGLFVLVQTGDSVTIADMPPDFKAREW